MPHFGASVLVLVVRGCVVAEITEPYLANWALTDEVIRVISVHQAIGAGRAAGEAQVRERQQTQPPTYAISHTTTRQSLTARRALCLHNAHTARKPLHPHPHQRAPLPALGASMRTRYGRLPGEAPRRPGRLSRLLQRLDRQRARLTPGTADVADALRSAVLAREPAGRRRAGRGAAALRDRAYARRHSLMTTQQRARV